MAPWEQKELGSVSIQDAKQAPVLTNCPQALVWFVWASSGEPWPGAHRSCYVASSWKSLWCQPGNSATQRYLSLGANSSAQFQCWAAAGAGANGKQLNFIFIPTSFVHAFSTLECSFLDLLFWRSIRPVHDRLLLCSPDNIRHLFFFSFHLIPHFSDTNCHTLISLQSFPFHCFLIYILNHVLKCLLSQKSCYWIWKAECYVNEP